MPWGQWSKKGGWEQTVLASSLAAAHTPRSEGGGNRTLHTDVFERCAKQDHKRGARKKVVDNVPQPSKKERNDVGGSAHSSYLGAHSWREGAFNGVYGQLKVFNANMNPHMGPNTTLPAVLPAPSGWEEM